MKRSTLVSLSRRALQLATLFLAAAPATFGGERVTADRDDQLIGSMVVTATPERPLIGHMVVTAARFAPTPVLVADLGAMTVTARPIMAFARNETPKAEMASP